jgi:photosystem II stability/assembly factor-like uncharacterized protein
MGRLLFLFLFFVLNVGWIRLGPSGGTFTYFTFLNGNSVITGNESSAYITNNNGKSWKKISQGGIVRHLPASNYLVSFDVDDEIFLSKDSGANWEKRFEFTHILPDLSSSASDELHALVYDGNLSFYVSNDFGMTWSAKSIVVADLYTRDVRIVESGNDVYAVVGARIFRSENSGSSWKKLGNAGLPCCPIVLSFEIDKNNPKVFYISTKLGIFKSVNAGNSWVKIKDGSFASLAIHPKESQTLYAVGSRKNYSAVPTAIKSIDGGKSWKTLRMPSRIFTEVSINPFVPNSLLVAAEDYGILKSENDGASWTSANNGLNSLSLYQLQLSPKGFVTRSNTSMLFSQDGKKWLNTTGAQFTRAISIVSNKNASVATTCCPNKTLVSYNGLNWHILPQGEKDPSFISIDAIKPRTIYLFSNYSGRKTDDDGRTWKPISIKDIKFQGINYITAFSTGNDADTLLVGTFNGTFYRSVDGGKSWKKSIPGGAEIYEITSDPKNSDVIYVGAIVGASSLEKRPVLFRTSDAGSHWEIISDPTPGGLRINPSNTSEIVAVNPQLLISHDSGKTWNNFSPELNSVDAIYDLMFDSKDPRKVYVATSSGIFSTSY